MSRIWRAPNGVHLSLGYEDTPDLATCNIDDYSTEVRVLEALSAYYGRVAARARVLAKYAKIKAEAVDYRQRGLIDIALRCERCLDTMYRNELDPMDKW